MTFEEFKEFTQRVDKMKDILSWVKTNGNGTFLVNEHGGLDCMDCPINRFKPEWIVPTHHYMCAHLGTRCTEKYENAFNIWDKENAKFALEEALDDI